VGPYQVGQLCSASSSETSMAPLDVAQRMIALAFD
jgi:hypothetical protein